MPALVKYVGINHCRRFVGMVEQSLHCADVVAGLGVSVMKPQLSDQQVISFNAIHHAVLIRYAA